MADAIHAYFQDECQRAKIEELRTLGVKLTQDRRPTPAQTGGPDLTGKTFVVTGTLSKYAREDIETLIRQARRQSGRQRLQEHQLPRRP